MAKAQTNIMHRKIYGRIVEMTGLVICLIVEKQAIHLNAQLNNTFMTLVVFDIYWECVRAAFILLPGYFFFLAPLYHLVSLLCGVIILAGVADL